MRRRLSGVSVGGLVVQAEEAVGNPVRPAEPGWEPTRRSSVESLKMFQTASVASTAVIPLKSRAIRYNPFSRALQPANPQHRAPRRRSKNRRLIAHEPVLGAHAK